MAIASRRILLMPVAFAGVLIFSHTFLAPAAAFEFAPPVARALEAARCATLSPRFEPPVSRGSPQVPVLVRFPGGGKLRSLVGEPCPNRPRPRDV
jgi:hypothetical protein